MIWIKLTIQNCFYLYDSILDMEDFDFYPQKPELIETQSKGGAGRTIFSLLILVLAFLLIGSEINFILYILLVVMIHEAGHYVMMKLFGYKDVRMLFVPLVGAFIQGKKEIYNQKQSLLVVLAGPIPGILIGLGLLYYSSIHDLEWVKDVSLLFLLINMINLIPLDPLDGGQILKLLLNKNQELFQMVLAFLFSLLMIGIGWYTEFWTLVVVGFLLGFRVRAIQKNYNIHKELDEENVNFKTTYKSLSNKDFSIIKKIVLDYTPALRTYMDQVNSETIDPIVADQVNNVLVSPLERNTTLFFRIMVILIWIASFALPIYMALVLNSPYLKHAI